VRLGLGGLLACCIGAAGPLEELPVPAPALDPQSLLSALLPRLPANWRLSEPGAFLGVPEVRVNIAQEWRGNPIAAAISLCPGTENVIWHQTLVIRLIMRQNRHDWPPWDCRP
jgi:hypothetical protein